jgi:hypothetical protein
VDPRRDPYCPNCGATLSTTSGFGPPPASAPAAPAGLASPLDPSELPWKPTPAVSPIPDDGTTRTRPRSEALASGPVFTIVAAIVIVLALAVAGIVAGQALGR